MSCSFPVGIYKKTGEKTFRPCGRCMDCRLGYSADWAARCANEAQMHEENCFLTLTYNNDNIPKNGSISPIEMQKFMKRLRREIEPKKVRFFGSGEYGEKLGRPHYHICLFGFNFPDREILKARRFKRSKFGNYDHLLYTSEMLGGIWKKGYHSVSDLTYQSAGYTARYITKKKSGEKFKDHYGQKHEEFALMSRGQKKDGLGGIGKTWFEKYKYDVYPKDYYHIEGKRVRPPKYYDQLLKRSDPKLYNLVKYNRMLRKEKEITEEGESYKDRDDSIRQMQKENYRKNVIRRLERTLENGNYYDVRSL